MPNLKELLKRMTMFRTFMIHDFWRPIYMISQRHTCASRSLQRLHHNSGGRCSHSQSTSPIFDKYRSRNSPEPKLIVTVRKMSSSVPAEWRKFMNKFQETKSEQDGLAKFFINKDLSYGEFNKFGRLNPWCILDYFEASLNLYEPKFAAVNENVSLFARNIEMNFKEGMEGRFHPDHTLKVRVCLTYLGKSSVCWESQCLDPSTGEELGNFLIQMVTVDMKERKPKPYAYMLKEFCPENLRERPPNGFDLEFKPETAFKHEFVVNWSDTDFNSHLNQVDIVRMCIDCGSFAAMKNALSAFTRELVAYDLKRCSVMFMKEARPGEKVLVECWESEGSPLVLNFAFSKENDLITMVQLEYHSGDASIASNM